MVLRSRREGLDWISREVLYKGSSEVLEQATQRGSGCSVPGGVQGQVGWGPGQPGLVLNEEVGGPACGQRRGWSFMILDLGTFQPRPLCDSVNSAFFIYLSLASKFSNSKIGPILYDLNQQNYLGC